MQTTHYQLTGIQGINPFVALGFRGVPQSNQLSVEK